MNVSQQATNTVYLIDDGTGKVEARRWREQSSEEDVEKWGNIECVFVFLLHTVVTTTHCTL